MFLRQHTHFFFGILGENYIKLFYIVYTNLSKLQKGEMLRGILLSLFLALNVAFACAVEVKVASKTNSVFTSWDYKCDGSNDHVEIQQALDFVRSNGGGTVHLSDGIFNLARNIQVPSYTIFKGHDRDATILRLSNNAARFTKAGFIRSIQTTNVDIVDMTIDGNRANQATDSDTNYGRYGVFTERSNYTTMDNLRVINWYGYGLDPHGEGGVYLPSYYVTATNNIVTDNGWDGITIDKTEYATVAYNTVLRNGRHGINIVTGTKFASVHDNDIQDNGHNFNGMKNGCGIMIQNNQGFDTRDAFVQNNYISNATRAGICLTDVENIDIITNNIQKTNICLRVKDITSIETNNIAVENNICPGLTQFRSDTSGYNGPIPVFLPTLTPKSEYIVAAQGYHSINADFNCTGINDEDKIMIAAAYLGLSGGIITLSAGTFFINKNIQLTSNVVLRGQNVDETIVKLKNSADSWRVGTKSFAGMIRGFEIKNLVLKDFTLDGNRLNQPSSIDQYGRYGFYCEVCDNVLLKNLKINNHNGYGVDPHGAPGELQYSDGFTIENCVVEDNAWDGVTIDKTLNTVIKQNTIRNNGRHGINIVTGSKYVVIDQNTVLDNGWYYFTGSKGCGITMQNNELLGTAYIEAKNNIVTNSSSSSICIRDTDHTRFLFNTINGPSNCMRFQQSAYIYLESNTCLNSKTINIESPYSDVTLVDQSSIKYI
jgi:parallel beta-helix repeat protein